MIKKKVAIYCSADSDIYPGEQRNYLDACFFRLLAYAHAHRMQVIKYYEDAKGCSDNDSRLGIVQLQFDLAKEPIDAILVIDSQQLSNRIDYKYLQLVVSIKTTERL